MEGRHPMCQKCEEDRSFAEIANRQVVEERMRKHLMPVLSHIRGWECECEEHCEGAITHLLGAIVPDVAELANMYAELRAQSLYLALSVIATDDTGDDDE